MLRRRRDDLPTTFAPTANGPDGSGKSIKMDAPLVKAIRSAEGATKYTYMWFFGSLVFIWMGWSLISRGSASMVLDCKSTGCSLTINKPKKFTPRNVSFAPRSIKTKRKVRVEFKRDQVVRADNILWDPEGAGRIVENFGLASPSYDGERKMEEEEEDREGPTNKKARPNKPWKEHKKYKKQQQRNKYKKSSSYSAKMFGPDENGYYNSYILVLRDPTPELFDESNNADIDGQDNEESPSKKMQRQMQSRHKSMLHDPNSLAAQLAPFLVRSRDDADSLEYNIHLRDFNIGQTRRLARTSVAKINSFANGRRSSFAIREARPVSWQGLTLLILGVFSLILCLLLGQFREEYDPTRDGSYRKRMAEIRRRKEAEMSRKRNYGSGGGRKNVVKPTPVRSGYQGVGRSGGVSTGVGGNMRMRTSASSGAESRGSSGGAGYSASKRGD
ncbi:hypothetical protein HJC23_008854 [Cyclotella cryptica]|uniref:Uncharacterized protein n=1 Tax=Cyclotella cryptica TaxID=29204 RepID=A0ABD3NP79_9STRA|eukprot:CCRYP_020291-RA/>CCRYP_020291-RA protein AED:0.03 eAED:0.03 QI:83/1/1/1/1/1/2/245/443